MSRKQHRSQTTAAWARGLTVVSIVLALAVPAAAQQTIAEQSIADLQAFMTFVVDFTEGVELDEAGIDSVLEHWSAFEELTAKQGDDEELDSPAEVRRELEEALTDPTYRDWAADRGIELDPFLRDAMRVQSLFMVRQWEENREAFAAQREQLETMVEQQCAQVSPEMCAQMREGVKQAQTISSQMSASIEEIRPASDREAELLQRYESDLWSLFGMGSGGDGDEG